MAEKIWDSHVVHDENGVNILYIDRHLVHEVTSPQAFEGLRLAGRKLRAPGATYAVPDHNVPTGESEQMYTALKLLGKEVEYIRVEGEDHWILDYKKRIVWSNAIISWFDRWLKDQPQWWNSMYPPLDDSGAPSKEDE